MAAYNWIDVEAKCPNCNQVACIRCQTHIASDYGGDETGRFSNREYRLGDTMAWWPESHPEFTDWTEKWRGDNNNLPPGQAAEACYAKCDNCKADLCVVIQFENLRPLGATQITLEVDWPEGYSA